MLFALSSATMTAGLMTFGVISYRFVHEGLTTIAAVPLLIVPVLVAIVPLCVFATQVWLVLVGIVVWGAATGIQDSTVKAYVADLVPASRRATAYGVFAAIQGIGALFGGVLAGSLMEEHARALAAALILLQGVSLLLLLRTTRTIGIDPGESSTSDRGR